MAMVLRNGRVLAGEVFRDDVAVVIEDARIADVRPADDPHLAGLPARDLEGGWLMPGFIDIQVNGGGGGLFNNEPTPDGLRAIAAAHRRFGTTGLLPTLISDTPEKMALAVAAARQAIADGVPGILGIHLEGPYINPVRKGTHDAHMLRLPDTREIEVDTSLGNGVTLITLAPEEVPPADIRAFVERGAIVFGGHSAASYEQALAGIASGIRGFTHLYNAMSQLVGREPGMAGAALDDPDTWVGIIADGVHVHPASLRIAVKAKPRGKVMLVTDAMPPVGSENKSYQLNGETVSDVDGVIRNSAGALAGSALDMATAVRNAVRWLGVDLAEAARMASLYPAQCLRIDDRYGRIVAGHRADLVLLDRELQVRDTWIGGIAA